MPFVLSILNSQIPQILIDGQVLCLVSFSYEWMTKTEEDDSKHEACAIGFLPGDTTAKAYLLNFETMTAKCF